jgi:ureidoglycolate dehydrogenase (NAD+)
MDACLAIQADGRDITDPGDFDLTTIVVLPMAGPKGYGIMMMVDVLAGALAGSRFATAVDCVPGGGT